MHLFCKKYTLLIILILLFSRMGAVVHASEHVLLDEYAHCAICSVNDHQYDALIPNGIKSVFTYIAQGSEPYSNPLYRSLFLQAYRSRAPPFIS